MINPLEEIYEAVLLDVCEAATFRSNIYPDEPLAVNVSLAFISGMALVLHHPEYARALATQFDGPDRLKVMADAIVLGNPIGVPIDEAEGATT